MNKNLEKKLNKEIKDHFGIDIEIDFNSLLNKLNKEITDNFGFSIDFNSLFNKLNPFFNDLEEKECKEESAKDCCKGNTIEFDDVKQMSKNPMTGQITITLDGNSMNVRRLYGNYEAYNVKKEIEALQSKLKTMTSTDGKGA